jgi:hypothetical protein
MTARNLEARDVWTSGPVFRHESSNGRRIDTSSCGYTTFGHTIFGHTTFRHRATIVVRYPGQAAREAGRYLRIEMRSPASTGG